MKNRAFLKTLCTKQSNCRYVLKWSHISNSLFEIMWTCIRHNLCDTCWWNFSSPH